MFDTENRFDNIVRTIAVIRPRPPCFNGADFGIQWPFPGLDLWSDASHIKS